MHTGPITITVDDPGYDWTAWFVVGGVFLALLAVGAILYYGMPRFTSSRRSARVLQILGEIFATAAILAFVTIPIVGGAVGWSVHSGIVHGDKRTVLEEEYGITDLEYYEYSSMVSAMRDGELVTGLMTETVPRTWVFQELVAAE